MRRCIVNVEKTQKNIKMDVISNEPIKKAQP
jgi:hypothetical protein